MQQILAFLLSLSILIFLHELGHFFFARLFKTRVEKFYLFFNPYFSLVRCKKVKGKWRFSFFSKKSPEEWSESEETTEWGIGWLPLGGYCSIAGMIDETTSADQLSSEPQTWEYRAKKPWQRLLIISGGVLTNFILASIIFSAMLFTWGKEELPIQNAKLGYDFHQLLIDEGFKNGDIPIETENKILESSSDFTDQLLIKGAKQFKVLRDKDTQSILLSDSLVKQLLAARTRYLLNLRIPFVVKDFMVGMPASKSGIQKGDQIVGINESSTPAFSDFIKTVTPLRNERISLDVMRSDSLLKYQVVTNDSAMVGIICETNISTFFQTKKMEYGLIESIPAGFSVGAKTLSSYVGQLKHIFSREGVKQVGGFITIGGFFPKVWDWQQFWSLTALLSIILAFMNILPIPALDGGHIMFTVYEMITRRKPGVKFLERAQMIGMIFLFALLIYANGNDIIRLILR